MPYPQIASGIIKLFHLGTHQCLVFEYSAVADLSQSSSVVNTFLFSFQVTDVKF